MNNSTKKEGSGIVLHYNRKIGGKNTASTDKLRSKYSGETPVRKMNGLSRHAHEDNKAK